MGIQAEFRVFQVATVDMFSQNLASRPSSFKEKVS